MLLFRFATWYNRNMEKDIKKDLSPITKIHAVVRNAIRSAHVRTFDDAPRYSHCFAFILSGSATYTTRTHVFRVEAGDVLYLAKKEEYVIDVTEMDYTFIFADFELESDEKYASCALKSKNKDKIRAIFFDALRLYNAKSKTSELRVVSLLSSAYADLSEDLYASASDKAKILPAYEYIVEHYCEEISVPYLAALCKMSEVHLRRLYAKVYGTTPIEHIATLRFEKANNLLSLGENPVWQIAENCGFKDVYYFSKAYKRKYGVSPTKR